ncbi:hypothetical protein BTO28_12335 [Domibacillus epiphyticus]|uniref:Uncharacterized protein n=1 Tax=Domibacillus epiphyticus TaxID=1714355 RepID=A0A1V2A6I8_9BACI|nr:hypothetical protein BTO28_12335 [Domibacillus epiphyticus]
MIVQVMKAAIKYGEKLIIRRHSVLRVKLRQKTAQNIGGFLTTIKENTLQLRMRPSIKKLF